MHIYERLRVDSERPQIRQIKRAAELLRDGLFAVVPTETTYAIVAQPEALKAQDAIRQLRRLDEKHLWSLMCADLSQASKYVLMNNEAHRIVRRCMPGPFTFILPANSQLPKRVFGKRRDLGIRMPDSPLCRMLLEELGEPLVATSMQFADEDEMAVDTDLIHARIKHLNCLLLDGGWGGMIPTTVVDLCGEEPQLLREGLGQWPC